MTNVLEADLYEIAQLPLVTKISKGEVAQRRLPVAPVYDRTDAKPRGTEYLWLEQGDEVYVYENALGATYACYMNASNYRYFARITPGVDVIITEEGIYYV